MARTHKSLEGKKVIFIDSNGKETVGIITGCNKDIGISIQEKENMENYLLCLLCPSAPNFGDSTEKENKEAQQLYKLIVKQLLMGKADVRKLSVVSFEEPTADFCPFSQ
jgi:hypothetical protein